MSFHTHDITFEEHTAWFERQLQIGNPFYIAYFNTAPLGYARFDGDKENVAISVAVTSELRGHGLGVQLIKAACHIVLVEKNIQYIHAFIRSFNSKSIHAFLKAGFIPNNTACNRDIAHLQYPGYAECKQNMI
jgi:RimJ/RimL family protein N-acetyltransferase